MGRNFFVKWGGTSSMWMCIFYCCPLSLLENNSCLLIVIKLSFSVAVYRIYTAILFHGSLLHVLFNMMALVPLGSELERIMGSVRLLYMTILLATSNALFHLLIALVVAYNPFRSYQYLMNQCAIGFSGILFSMIVIETSLSGVQSRRWVLYLLFWNIIWQLFFFPLSWFCGCYIILSMNL